MRISSNPGTRPKNLNGIDLEKPINAETNSEPTLVDRGVTRNSERASLRRPTDVAGSDRRDSKNNTHYGSTVRQLAVHVPSRVRGDVHRWRQTHGYLRS